MYNLTSFTIVNYLKVVKNYCVYCETTFATQVNSNKLLHSTFNMSVLKPPEQVRGLKEVDKTKFDREIVIPSIKITGAEISKVIPYLKKYLLKLKNMKPIQTSISNVTEILLNPDLVKYWFDISESDRESLKKLLITEKNFTFKNHVLGYENYNVDEIFKSVLPNNEEGMSSYSAVGHIIQVNLKEHLLPYKKLIGQVLFDKIPNVRTVVNKLDGIDNTFRYFKMEVLCGEDDMMATVKENKCLFEFDFSAVYWNSRLSTEHERVVDMIKPGEVLFDVFAGVGPFAIPVAKKKSFVYANDLNPESYKWLNHNVKLNKVNSQYIKTYNKDGGDFILNDVKQQMLKYINSHNIFITMNLPALAVEFLNKFYKLFETNELKKITRPPTVLLYCFTKGQEDCFELAKNLVNKNMGLDISDNIINIIKVRTVSSYKEMMRLTIKLDESILFGKESNSGIHKRKTEDSNISNSSKKNCHGKEQEQTRKECL